MEPGVGHMATVAVDAVPFANQGAVCVQGGVQADDLVSRRDSLRSLETSEVTVVDQGRFRELAQRETAAFAELPELRSPPMLGRSIRCEFVRSLPHVAPYRVAYVASLSGHMSDLESINARVLEPNCGEFGPSQEVLISGRRHPSHV